MVNQRLTNRKRGMLAKHPGLDGKVADAPQHSVQATIQLSIESMGCVACINKIDASIRKSSDKIVQASSWLNERDVEGNRDRKGGQARVVIRTLNEEEVDETLQVIISSLVDAGFPCELKKLELTDDLSETG